MSQLNKDQIIIKHRGSGVPFIYFGAIMGGLGVLMMLGFMPRARGRSYEAEALLMMGIGVLGISLAILVLGLVMSYRKTNGIILSPVGVYDPQFMRAEIPWENVKGWTETQYGGHPVFALMLHKQPPEGRPLRARAFTSLGKTPALGYRKMFLGRPVSIVKHEFDAAARKILSPADDAPPETSGTSPA